MERIYCDMTGDPATEEFNEFLLKYMEAHYEAEKKLSKDDYNSWAIAENKNMREKFDLPNKVFIVARNKERTKAKIIFFPKEPDGNSYETFYDEELNRFYILVD